MINGKQKNLSMDKFLLETSYGHECDHKNRNPLDNRRSNLRPATRRQNGANKGLGKRNTSGYKGVSAGRAGKWRGMVSSFYLGTFVTKVDAAIAVDRVAKEIWGKFAVLNFPDE
jgi:hypothetical protein